MSLALAIPPLGSPLLSLRNTEKIIGICAALALAGRDVIEHGWRNVELLATPVQDAMITEAAMPPFLRRSDCPIPQSAREGLTVILH